MVTEMLLWPLRGQPSLKGRPRAAPPLRLQMMSLLT